MTVAQLTMVRSAASCLGKHRVYRRSAHGRSAPGRSAPYTGRSAPCSGSIRPV